MMSSAAGPKFHLQIRPLPFLVGLLILLQVLVPFKGWMILLVILGGIWLTAYLWARALSRGLNLTREMRYGWAQVGDRVEERFTLSNSAWFPGVWVEIIDRSTLPDYHAASRATGVGGNSENTWQVSSVCSRRGAFILGPTTVRSGDPFGVYTVALEFPSSMTMFVMPPVVPLPHIQIAPGGRMGEGRRRVKSWERTVSAASVRDYVPGDNPGWIHWPITAHRDALSVRTFDNTPSSDWWIFLDLNSSVQAGQGQDSTLEHGVILAASLASQGLRSGHGVGLVANGHALTWIEPERGEAQRWKILHELALVAGGSYSLCDLLERVGGSFRQRTSLVVITADTEGEWIQSLSPFLRRGTIPTVLLFDRKSFGGAGDVRRVIELLTDMEIAHHVIPRGILDRPEAKPGREGLWEWRVSPLGRAVAIHSPRERGWRSLV